MDTEYLPGFTDGKKYLYQANEVKATRRSGGRYKSNGRTDVTEGMEEIIPHRQGENYQHRDKWPIPGDIQIVCMR